MPTTLPSTISFTEIPTGVTETQTSDTFPPVQFTTESGSSKGNSTMSTDLSTSGTTKALDDSQSYSNTENPGKHLFF